MSQWEEDFPDDEMMGGTKKTDTISEAPPTTDETPKSADSGKVNAPTEVNKPQTPSVPGPVIEIKEKAVIPVEKLPEKAPVELKADEEKPGNKISTSGDIINEQESRLNAEMQQLLKDICRIGEEGKPEVAFGDLFDDDEVANYYEALVGTLKGAKKRGLIEFKGQMLLKGPHDKVIISLVDK